MKKIELMKGEKELRTIVSSSESKTEMQQSKDKITVGVQKKSHHRCQTIPSLSE